MTLQKLLSYVRRALNDFNMIQDNDIIAVGISGGKDSLALLCALAKLRDFYPNRFEIKAITVDLGYHNFNLEPIQSLCHELNVEYIIEKTHIAEIIFEERKEANPCSLCAKMRKGSLNQRALQLGCNKIAYAHHMDDIIETFFLSLIYEGRLSTIQPVTYFEDTKLTVIRPLLYAPEANIIGFINKYQFQPVKNPCPADGYTKREYAKDLIRKLNHDNPGVKQRIFHAIMKDIYYKYNDNRK